MEFPWAYNSAKYSAISEHTYCPTSSMDFYFNGYSLTIAVSRVSALMTKSVWSREASTGARVRRKEKSWERISQEAVYSTALWRRRCKRQESKRMRMGEQVRESEIKFVQLRGKQRKKQAKRGERNVVYDRSGDTKFDFKNESRCDIIAFKMWLGLPK